MKVSFLKYVTLSIFLTALGCHGDRHSLGTPEGSDTQGIIAGQAVTTDDDSRLSIVFVMTQGAFGIPAEKCTGVLVGPDLVLTAAHCVPKADQKAKVGFGTNFRESFQRSRKTPPPLDVVDFKVHPLYEPGSQTRLNYDLAVLKLAKEVDSSRVIKELAPVDFDIHDENLHFEIIGYGLDGSDNNNLGSTLFKKDFSPQDLRPQIDLRPKGPLYIPEKALILAQSLGGACNGDSGGPLLAQPLEGSSVVVGIASSVINPSRRSSECYGFSIYTDVRQHLEWVQQIRSEFNKTNESHGSPR